MTGELSVFQLVGNASLMVQLVMALLLIASFVSWTIILRKSSQLRATRHAVDKFEDQFWSGGDLTTLYRKLETEQHTKHGMENIFESGFREFNRLLQHGVIPAEHMLEGSRRAMRVATLRETDRLEGSLAMLATIGSTSPYVGLFGTVWGIMSAFHGLGNVEQATLALVAPGISEALVATAMGLFAAIPAVIFYNRYADQVSRLVLRYDTFVEELSTLLQRHTASRTASMYAKREGNA